MSCLLSINYQNTLHSKHQKVNSGGVTAVHAMSRIFEIRKHQLKA